MMEFPATEEPVAGERPSVGSLISDLLRDVATLFRQEVGLAKVELAEKAREAKGGLTKIGIGAALGLAAALVLAAAIVLGLTLLLSQWMEPLTAAFVSALGVGVILGAVAFVLLRKAGEDLSPENFVPERTVESLKEDARWAKERL